MKMSGALTAERGLWRLCLALALVSSFSVGLLAPPAGAEVRDVSQWVALPVRRPQAPTGSEFIKSLSKAKPEQREEAIYQEVRRGNIPTFNRHLIPVSFSQTLDDGREHHVTLFVSADYLAIGSDSDNIRMPVSLPTAFRIADALNLALPTKKIVDLVYQHSVCHLVPSPLPAGKRMTSNNYYMKHQKIIEKQAKSGSGKGRLIAGHKKDLVITGRLLSKHDRVAIYGWHRPSGKAIQPLSTVHEAAYADYSHGLRLISPLVLIDGQLLSVNKVLADKKLAGLLSDEGPIAVEAIRSRCGRDIS